MSSVDGRGERLSARGLAETHSPHHRPRETSWASAYASETWASGALLLFSEGPAGPSTPGTSNSNGGSKRLGGSHLALVCPTKLMSHFSPC